MFPIILSQARAQSKEAERTGSSIPGKGCTTTLTLGDPNSTQQQASHSKWPDFSALLSLLRAQLSAPSQDWVHSPPARPPPPDTQPTIPGTPPKAHAASRHKTSLEAQSLLSESSPRGVPRAKLPGVHSWRKGSGVGGVAARIAKTRRRAPAPSLAVLPGRTSFPRRGAGPARNDQPQGARAPGKGTPLTPRNAGPHGASSRRGDRHGSCRERAELEEAKLAERRIPRCGHTRTPRRPAAPQQVAAPGPRRGTRRPGRQRRAAGSSGHPRGPPFPWRPDPELTWNSRRVPRSAEWRGRARIPETFLNYCKRAKGWGKGNGARGEERWGD